MHAVILAGGEGRRLRPFTTIIPKPLVPVGSMPILEILIRQLVAQEFERISISVGYLAPLVEAYCGDGSKWGTEIRYIHEHEPLGTAGFLSLMRPHEDDRLLLINGDTLTDADLAAVYRKHCNDDAASICVARRSSDIDFGVVDDDEEGLLISYAEKPKFEFNVSMGVNVLSTWAIAEFLTRPRHIDMPALLVDFVNAGFRVRVFPIDAYWLDMGRWEDLEAATAAIEANPERFIP
jgi:NDP-mannose synthase